RIRSAFHPAGKPPSQPPGGTVTGPAVGSHEPPATSATAPVDSTPPADRTDQISPLSESSSPGEERESSSAVGLPAGTGAATPVGTVSVTNGRVHFVLAVSRPEELSQLGRRSLQFYGEEFHEWAPYRPQQNDPLAVLARSVAAERLFESEIADCEELLAR